MTIHLFSSVEADKRRACDDEKEDREGREISDWKQVSVFEDKWKMNGARLACPECNNSRQSHSRNCNSLYKKALPQARERDWLDADTSRLGWRGPVAHYCRNLSLF